MMESQMMKWRKMEEEATGQRTQVTPGAEKLGKQLLPPQKIQGKPALLTSCPVKLILDF